ncbi:hypothetical protein Tco_0649255, partial [Tanacetum coccineum]
MVVLVMVVLVMVVLVMVMMQQQWCYQVSVELRGSGECEGEDVILKGEVEGSVTSSIVGNRATSWP